MNRWLRRLVLIAAIASLSVLLTFIANAIQVQQSSNPQPTQPPDLVSPKFSRIFQHYTADVNGVQLHYVRGGSGAPVVLLHGWSTTWYEWHKIMPALAQNYTVIAPDLRGLGDSSKPETGYDKRTLAEDVYQLVRQLSYPRIFLVGHDLGGQVAYAYASAHPQEVRRLVIMEVPIPGLPAWDEVTKDIWHFGFHAIPELPEALVAGRERTYLNYFYTSGAYQPPALKEVQISEYVRAYSDPKSLHAGFEYYRAFPKDAEHNQEYAKTKLPMPVLTMGGETSLKDGLLKQLQPVSENVRNQIVPRAGHWIPDERPDFLIEQLLAFFSSDRT